jgi:hypothetical protein
MRSIANYYARNVHRDEIDLKAVFSRLMWELPS